MQNKIKNLVLDSLKLRRQLIALATVFFFLGLMSLGVVEIAGAATTSDTNIAQNVSAGTLDIDSAPAQLNFNGGTPGQTTIANTTTGGVVTNDTRGSFLGWSTTGYFNTNFLKTGDANVQMAINQGGTLRMFWGANNGGGGSTITNVTGDSGDAIGGANNNFPGIGSSNTLLLMNDNAGTFNGAGAYNMTNLKFNYQIPVSAEATNYTTNLRLTIA